MENIVDLSHFLFGTFFERVRIEIHWKKQVLNEGVMACIFSINMESTFLVALARRASKKSVKIWQNVGQLTFSSLFFPPQFLTPKIWSKFPMNIFHWKKNPGRISPPTLLFWESINKKPEKSRLTGIDSPQLQTLWFPPLWVVALAAGDGMGLVFPKRPLFW